MAKQQKIKFKKDTLIDEVANQNSLVYQMLQKPFKNKGQLDKLRLASSKAMVLARKLQKENQ